MDDTQPIPVIGEEKSHDWLWLFWVVAIVFAVLLIGYSVVNAQAGIGGVPAPVSSPGQRTHS